MSKLRTAESVSPRHPDKLCDRVADAILDAYLVVDSEARTAVEVAGGHGRVWIFGEVSAVSHPDIEPIVRRIVGEDIAIDITLTRQSPEIARGVDDGGAGDQGIMVGYACDETPEHLPLELMLARRLNQFLYQRWPFDGKTQVTLDGSRIRSIVASFQNARSEELEDAVHQWLRELGDYGGIIVPANYDLYANPSGDWHIGGFDADSGLTGRKLVIDNYGPRIAIGGGSFSGKDATKVDRSAAYMARKIALDYLRAHNVHEVRCQLAYAIGRAEPLEVTLLAGGISRKVTGYDLTPCGISDFLQLRQPVFATTAEYGHFGHEEFAWES